MLVSSLPRCALPALLVVLLAAPCWSQIPGGLLGIEHSAVPESRPATKRPASPAASAGAPGEAAPAAGSWIDRAARWWAAQPRSKKAGIILAATGAIMAVSGTGLALTGTSLILLGAGKIIPEDWNGTRLALAGTSLGLLGALGLFGSSVASPLAIAIGGGITGYGIGHLATGK